MLLFALSLVLPAHAKEFEGVTMPDTASVGGQSLVLNGMGLREKFFLNIYVGGLYLPAKTTDAQSAIDQDVPKKLVMHFQYSGGVPKDKMLEAYEEGLTNNAGALKSSQAENLKTFYGWLTDMAAGDEIVYEYVPGTGTTVFVKGQKKGTIEGVDFMKALFAIYLGKTPPTADLKSGLLGG
jgi:hypothetical protein